MVVYDIVTSEPSIEELTVNIKKQLLCIPTIDVVVNERKSPLLLAMSRTSNSLFECFAGTNRKILYPLYDN